MSTDTVPLCLYSNPKSGISYIGYPSKVAPESLNSPQSFVCQLKPNLTFETVFYAINPDFRPFPQGTVLIACTNSIGEFATTKISVQYDVYDTYPSGVKFIAWVEPVPHTTPLYIFLSEERVYASFSKVPPIGFENARTFPVYILMDPRTKSVQILDESAKTGNTDRFRIVNGQPEFRYGCHQERCVPDPTGTTLGDCIVQCTKKIYELTQDVPGSLQASPQQRPSLLTFLEAKYGKKTDQMSWLTKLRPPVIAGIGVVFMVTLLFFLWHERKK